MFDQLLALWPPLQVFSGTITSLFYLLENGLSKKVLENRETFIALHLEEVRHVIKFLFFQEFTDYLVLEHTCIHQKLKYIVPAKSIYTANLIIAPTIMISLL